MVALNIYRDGPRDTQPAPAKIVDCGKCHACCVNEAIFLGPSDNVSQFDYVIAVNPATGLPGQMLHHKDNGECIYLADGRCSIWKDRPAICRVFDCGELWAQTPRRERKQLFGGPGHDKFEAAREQWRRRQPAKTQGPA